jgi:hypothetical protein
MITVKLQGGLGNQMFQYALGRSLVEKNKDRLVLDATFLLDRAPRKDFVFRNYDLDIFGINPRFTFLSRMARLFPLQSYYSDRSLSISNKKDLLGRQKYVREEPFGFHPEIFQLAGDLYLDGYWQSEKYFEEIKDLIRIEFSFGETENAKVKEMAEKIISTESVCLNVRRGDFANLPSAIKTHGFVGMDYYEKGIEIIASQVANPCFFITSDDIEWCVKNFKMDYPYVFLTHEYKGEKFKDYLRLMTLCKHFLIPNSSFAWWAAWLNPDPQKIVIAPKKWFNDPSIDTSDLIPESWLRM